MSGVFPAPAQSSVAVLLFDQTAQSTTSATFANKTTGVLTISNSNNYAYRVTVCGTQTVNSAGNNELRILLKSGANTTTFSALITKFNNAIGSYTAQAIINRQTNTLAKVSWISGGNATSETAYAEADTQTLAGGTTWASQDTIQLQFRQSAGAPSSHDIQLVIIERLVSP